MWGESVFHETRLLCLLQSMSLLGLFPVS
ncbi:hypothetical protein ACQJBY_006926 [Aegilops geniculata]